MTPDLPGGRPVMVTTDMDLAEASLDAMLHLRDGNEPPCLFMLGDAPVRVEPHPDDGRPITRELTVDRVVHHLANAIQFVKTTKHGQHVPTLPPVAIARNLLASPQMGLPSLQRIAVTPSFGCDGQLLCTPGYDLMTGVLYLPPEDFQFGGVSSQPSEIEIQAARQLLLDELLGDFPFVGEAERANAVGALLLPFVRDCIPGPTPLHLIEKPVAGTGGSLLADVLMRPSLGRPLPAMAAGRDTDEWRKRLTSILAESPVAVLFDNVRALESDALAAALTATTWSDRILGVSHVTHLPVRCTWLATANNPTITLELVRRVVRIRLDADTDRPWLRNGWRHPDLIAWAMAHRSQLISAALTLVQAWLACGKPAGSHPRLGTFEDWSRVIGGILSRAGIDGFLGNLTALYDDAADDETKVWHALVHAWWRTR